MFLDRVVHFGENLGEQVKGRPTRKVKSLVEIPYVTRLNVQVLKFNMNLISSWKRVPRPSYPFRGKFGDQVKGSFTEKAKIVDCVSLCSAPKNTGSKLQYEPYLFSIAGSWTKLSISWKIWEIR